MVSCFVYKCAFYHSSGKTQDSKFEESLSWDKISKFNINEHYQVFASLFFFFFFLPTCSMIKLYFLHFCSQSN